MGGARRLPADNLGVTVELGGIMKELPLGAHLVSSRGPYSHHGVYVGDGKVVHYAGLADGLKAGPVEEADLEVFAGVKGWRIREHAKPKFAPGGAP